MNEWVEYMTFDSVSPMAELRAENGHKEPWKIKYFGVGNESWGCGGNMDPEYYGDLFKRYNTYVRDYDSNYHINRIACGPNGNDYHWTKQVMDKVKYHANGLSLHYYTVPTGNWDHKGSATEFDEAEYDSTISKAYEMELLVSNHIKMMDSVKPDHRVKLVIDEWGTWFDVEPGTNPGFLYQQSTMRDAVVAGLTLNIFNKHADRIMMANIAQTVNVLQAVILTDGDKMVLTPTYHIFKMYKDHQENTLVGSFLTTKELTSEMNNKKSYPQLTESASIDENGVVYSTLTNCSASEAVEIKCQVADTSVTEITAEILTGDIHDKNDFENGERVTVKAFNDFEMTADGFIATIPACSIVKFIIK